MKLLQELGGLRFDRPVKAVIDCALESLLARHGTLLSTAANGRRYDSCWSHLTAAADDDDERKNMNLFNGIECLPTSLRVLVIVKTIKH